MMIIKNQGETESDIPLISTGRSTTIWKAILFITLLISSMPAYSQKSAVFQWLAGTWEINTGRGIISESWQVLDDSTLVGKSVFIKNGKDTIPQETLKLVFQFGDWHYISRVVGQNEGKDIPFKIIFQSGTEFISENPTHDFPQRISYRKVSEQLMYASIEGRKNGKYNKQNFNFSKK